MTTLGVGCEAYWEVSRGIRPLVLPRPLLLPLPLATYYLLLLQLLPLLLSRVSLMPSVQHSFSCTLTFRRGQKHV
jgi:hypothetical protein